MLRRLGASLLFAALALPSCGGDRCADEPVSFELDLTVASDVDVARVKGLTVVLLQGAERWRRTYTVTDELEDRETSLAVELDPAPMAPFMVELQVTARTTVGDVVAQSSGRFLGRPDGCNRFGLELAKTSSTSP